MIGRVLITLAMITCIVNCMNDHETPFSAEALFTWSSQVIYKLNSTFSYTVSVINNSPWQLDFPKTLHASGGVVSMPSGLKPTEKDTFVSKGATSTEGLLSFPINGDSRHLTIYWKVPETNNSQENTIGVYFGSLSVDDTLLQQMRNGTLPGFEPVKSKDTWFTYFLDQQVTAQVMMSDQKNALAALEISFGYQAFSQNSGTYKIQPKYKLTIQRVEWNGKVLQQVADNPSLSQQWQITKIEGNFYKLINVKHQCALTIVNELVLGCVGYDSTDINQSWEIIRLNVYDYKIKGASSTLYLDNNYSEASFWQLILWEGYETDTQIFRMIKI